MHLPLCQAEILRLMVVGKQIIEYAGMPFGRGYSLDGHWFSARVVHQLEKQGLIHGLGQHNHGETFEITDLGRRVLSDESGNRAG